MSLTHEQWLHEVRKIALFDGQKNRGLPAREAERLASLKLLYGLGASGRGITRGYTVFKAWDNGTDGECAMQVCAAGESSVLQVACTTLHELGHAMAGHQAGHGPEWKAACKLIGLRRAKAAGQKYYWADLEPGIRQHLTRLAVTDGAPAFLGKLGTVAQFKQSGGGCKAGHGTRGGQSRGKGSGSRLRLWECECAPKPIKVRVSSDNFQAHCDRCGAAFKRP
jgi:hypothetical protein